MRFLIPAVADAVLTDGEMELCLRHYMNDKPARPWIDEGDSAPDLVWDNRKKITRPSDATPSVSTALHPPPPSNVRWRDQYLELHLPKAEVNKSQQRTSTLAAAKAAKPQTAYVLISEDEEEDAKSKKTTSSNSLQLSSAASADIRRGRATNDTTSPSPRHSTGGGGGDGVSRSQDSRASQRQSTGSSVVYMSQPVKKAAGDAVAEKAQRDRSSTSKSAKSRLAQGAGEKVGNKRQRSMEEFMYRGA